MEVVSLEKTLAAIDDYWNPLIIGELNDQLVKVVKIQGEFVMHHHDAEDEMFLVVRGEMSVEFEDSVKTVKEGEFIIVPRGVPHRPVANKEAHIVLFEPKATRNTGNVVNELTVHHPKRLG